MWQSLPSCYVHGSQGLAKAHTKTTAASLPLLSLPFFLSFGYGCVYVTTTCDSERGHLSTAGLAIVGGGPRRRGIAI